MLPHHAPCLEEFKVMLDGMPKQYIYWVATVPDIQMENNEKKCPSEGQCWN